MVNNCYNKTVYNPAINCNDDSYTRGYGSTLVKDYRYPHDRVKIEDLYTPAMPFYPYWVRALELTEIERNLVTIPVRWANFQDLKDGAVPLKLTTWLEALVSGAMKSDIKEKQELYFFDKERLCKKDENGKLKFLGKKRPLGFKLHRILNTVQKIRQMWDSIEKGQLSVFPGPKVSAFKIESKGMAAIEPTIRTNANLEIGLHYNSIELEVKVLDYYQQIIEFEEDYLEVVNKEIFEFVRYLGYEGDTFKIPTAVHIMRGIANELNVRLIKATIQFETEKHEEIKRKLERKEETSQAKMDAHSMTFESLLDLALEKRNLTRMALPASGRIYTAFDSANPVDCPTREEFEREKRERKAKEAKERQETPTSPETPKGKKVTIKTPSPKKKSRGFHGKGKVVSKRKEITTTEGETQEESQPSSKKQHTDTEVPHEEESGLIKEPVNVTQSQVTPLKPMGVIKGILKTATTPTKRHLEAPKTPLKISKPTETNTTKKIFKINGCKNLQTNTSHATEALWKSTTWKNTTPISNT